MREAVGGGDGVVCFSNVNFAKKLTKVDSTSGQITYLPASSKSDKKTFSHITSIEMADHYALPQTTKVWLKSNLEARFPEKTQLDDGYKLADQSICQYSTGLFSSKIGRSCIAVK